LEAKASTAQFRIEPLSDDHKPLRAAFSCGAESLDRYLKQKASQDARSRAAVPYVLLSPEGSIAGFYTLSSTSFRIDDLPAEVIKPLKLPRYPYIGATLIGRLARDLSFRGQGIGEILLTNALKMSLRMSRQIASAAVIVDAKDENAHGFYTEYGFISFPDARNRLFLPMQTIEDLFPDQ
jgi:hypothetical protein